MIDEIAVHKLKEILSKFWKHEGGIMEAVDIVMALVMIVIVAAIGVFVADKVVTQTGTPSNANLSGMMNYTTGAGATGSSFLVILIIAFIGGISISYMFGLIGRRQSGK